MPHSESFGRNRKEALDQPKTEAMKNFETSLEPLLGLTVRLIPKDVSSALKSLQRKIKRSQQAPPPIKMGFLQRDVDKITTGIKNYLAIKDFLFEWMSVMMVTFLEGYLEDALISLATKNPKLMKDAPPIDHNRTLEVDSIDELRNEVRQQWAHDFLRPGGPDTWLRGLKNMGARGYDEKATLELQQLWDTRNLIVHSRGTASVAYARKYGVKKGERIKVSISQFQCWLDSIKSFTICTDAFFLKYGEARRNN